MSFPQPFAISDDFVPTTAPYPDQLLDDSFASAVWFLCRGSSILVLFDAETNQASLPENLDTHGFDLNQIQFLGYLNDCACVAYDLHKGALAKGEAVQAGYVWQSLRSLHHVLSDDLFAIAARAVQIVAWNSTHQYCGRCATPTVQHPTERAKRCPNCDLRQYPRLSPAVIMLIYKKEQLLLARAPRFRNGMYSVLAGFVEPGESLEEAVARETREEIGIEIQNIRYFGSQPWPFPNSLMVGFTAEYVSGTLTPEPGEIEDAAWFDKTDLPPVPGKLSIARKLIDWFVGQ